LCCRSFLGLRLRSRHRYTSQMAANPGGSSRLAPYMPPLRRIVNYAIFWLVNMDCRILGENTLTTTPRRFAWKVTLRLSTPGRALTEREQRIYDARRLQPPVTLQELADELHISRERVRQIEAKATAKASGNVDLPNELKLTFSADEMRVLQTGAQMLKMLTETRTTSWSMWLGVGEAMALLREKVMEAVGTSTPSGSNYNAVFGMALDRFGLRTANVTRTHLLDLMRNRQSVERWFGSLPPAEARSYRHPNTIWRKWSVWRREQAT
jgi:hypothetical protein